MASIIVKKTKLSGVLLIIPEVFRDKRGFFLESYNQEEFRKHNLDMVFIQENHSRSSKDVLRGLHFQYSPAQGKLVRCTLGKVFDVVVDLRKSSLTYGKWEGFLLSEENFKQLWVPPGFAHGFLALSNSADIQYKCTSLYNPNGEAAIRWDDPHLKINWGRFTKQPILSKKDQNAIYFDQYDENPKFL